VDITEYILSTELFKCPFVRSDELLKWYGQIKPNDNSRYMEYIISIVFQNIHILMKI